MVAKDSTIEHFVTKKTGAPVIGISGAATTSASVQAMMARVREAGATPLLLANHARRNAEKDLGKIDAVIVMGNNFDADPLDYISRYPQGDPRGCVHPKTKSIMQTQDSAARYAYEKQLITAALETKMPLFSICGGMQLLNILLGGTLHQHLPDLLGHEDHASNAGLHLSSPVIPVSIVAGSLLSRIAAENSLYAPHFPPITPSNGTVNSFHHQAVDIVGRDLIVCAFSGTYQDYDGREARLVEAIEASPDGIYKDQFVLGVQWHPEFLPDNATTERIIDDVRNAAQTYAKDTNRTHPEHEAKHETVLSALPMLKALSVQSQSFTEQAKPGATPTDRAPGKGKSR